MRVGDSPELCDLVHDKASLAGCPRLVSRPAWSGDSRGRESNVTESAAKGPDVDEQRVSLEKLEDPNELLAALSAEFHSGPSSSEAAAATQKREKTPS